MESAENRSKHGIDQHENRRKHRRIATRHNVTLVKLLYSDEIISHHSAVAETLDISKGGMRVTLKSPLLNNTVVQFSFDDSFPESLQTGIGKIQWCNKQIDTNVYQAGLAFQGSHIIEAMGLFLGIHDKQM
jgi:exoribonuclease II